MALVQLSVTSWRVRKALSLEQTSACLLRLLFSVGLGYFVDRILSVS